MMNEYFEGIGGTVEPKEMNDYDREILEEISKDMNTIFYTEH